jgi:NADH-quinone oxidoreductase subunit E
MKKRIADESVQPTSFEFNNENLKQANEILKKYPKDRKKSAILPLLHLAQEQHNNWIPQAALDYISNIIDIPYIKVYEVVSFYTMFNTVPVGKYLIQLCRTTPCWLRGSDKICKKIQDLLKIKIGETTLDGKFSLVEVECLGACVNAPVVQINNDYYEDLTENKIEEVIKSLKEK